MKGGFRRHMITQETFDAVKAAMEKYPTMSQKEVSALLTGSGIPVAPSTVSRLFRAQTFDDYIDITRAGYSKRETAQAPVTLCDMACNDVVLEAADDSPIEGISRAVINHVVETENTSIKSITDRLDAIIEQQNQYNDKMQTIAILLNALLNEWHGTNKTLDETMKGAINT